ncbi:MAG: type II secretion system protein [Verrucomicrobiaceae bacterium]|nr:type II secretion system protein [Verrucomicrobiaceae bacterium]
MNPEPRFPQSTLGGKRPSKWSESGITNLTSGFTLIEIIIALTIVGVLAAGTIPLLKGFRDERLAREPVAALVKLAREARFRAMTEKRPYQIAFHATGFTASRFSNPYLTRTQLMDMIHLSQNPPAPLEDYEKNSQENGGGATKTTELPLAPPPPKFDEHWTESYDKPDDMTLTLNSWRISGQTTEEGEKGMVEDDRVPIEGENVILWVFQPSGICMPLKIRIERQSAVFDIEFAALTGDIIKESVEIR